MVDTRAALNEIDRMLEKAIQTTRQEPYTRVQYARFADDMAILIDSHPQHVWLARAVEKHCERNWSNSEWR